MFVLRAETSGDELTPPKTIIVAASDDREKLVELKHKRATERVTYLASNAIPPWAQCSIISSETIEEVPYD